MRPVTCTRIRTPAGGITGKARRGQGKIMKRNRRKWFGWSGRPENRLVAGDELIMPGLRLYVDLVRSGQDLLTASIVILPVDDTDPERATGTETLRSESLRDATDFQGVHRLLERWAEAHGRFMILLFADPQIASIDLVNAWNKAKAGIETVLEPIFHEQEREARAAMTHPREPLWRLYARAFSQMGEPQDIVKGKAQLILAWLLIGMSGVPVFNYVAMPFAFLLLWPGFISAENSEMPEWLHVHYRHAMVIAPVGFVVVTLALGFNEMGEMDPVTGVAHNNIWPSIIAGGWLFGRFVGTAPRIRFQQLPKMISLFG